MVEWNWITLSYPKKRFNFAIYNNMKKQIQMKLRQDKINPIALLTIQENQNRMIHLERIDSRNRCLLNSSGKTICLTRKCLLTTKKSRTMRQIHLKHHQRTNAKNRRKSNVIALLLSSSHHVSYCYLFHWIMMQTWSRKRLKEQAAEAVTDRCHIVPNPSRRQDNSLTLM